MGQRRMNLQARLRDSTHEVRHGLLSIVNVCNKQAQRRRSDAPRRRDTTTGVSVDSQGCRVPTAHRGRRLVLLPMTTPPRHTAVDQAPVPTGYWRPTSDSTVAALVGGGSASAAGASCSDLPPPAPAAASPGAAPHRDLVRPPTVATGAMFVEKNSLNLSASSVADDTTRLMGEGGTRTNGTCHCGLLAPTTRAVSGHRHTQCDTLTKVRDATHTPEVRTTPLHLLQQPHQNVGLQRPLVSLVQHDDRVPGTVSGYIPSLCHACSHHVS